MYNLQGASFAVANIAGHVARVLAFTPRESFWKTLCAAARAGVYSENCNCPPNTGHVET
jgi:hypothetical protein